MQQLNIYGKTKEETAIDFLREHEPEEGYFLGFSGGKDSIVIHDLAKRSGVKFTPYYTLMPDPPELIRFIRRHYRHVDIIKSERSFYRQVETWFPPNRFARWCCEYIKEAPSKKIPLTYRILGIRAEESKARALQGFFNQRTKKRINVHPVFDWQEWEMWEYIERHRLPYCRLYDEGFNRLGCLPCPMRSVKEMQKYRDRWPKQFRLYERACEMWWDKKGHHRQSCRGYYKLFDDFMAGWYAGI